MIPLSRLGISKEERTMLAERLYPGANRIFLKRLAKNQGFNPEVMELLDYSEHPVWKMKKMMRDRQTKANFLKKSIENGTRNIDHLNVKYKTWEEATKNEPGKHVEMRGRQSIEELNKEIERLKLNHKMRINLEDLSSDDEKAPPLLRLERQSSQKRFNGYKDQDDEKEDFCGNI